jgi:hypothetical protein
MPAYLIERPDLTRAGEYLTLTSSSFDAIIVPWPGEGGWGTFAADRAYWARTSNIEGHIITVYLINPVHVVEAWHAGANWVRCLKDVIIRQEDRRRAMRGQQLFLPREGQ